MSLRTVQFLGRAYSPDGSDLTLSCIVNGQETHGITVPTQTGPTPDVDTIPDTQVLMTFEVDHTEFTAGDIPVIIRPTGGDIVFQSFFMNYQGIKPNENSTDANVVFDLLPEQYFQDINTNSIITDGKKNVKLDNVLVTDRDENVGDDPIYEFGEWYYLIPDGSTLTFDYVVEDVPYVQYFEFTGDGSTTVFTFPQGPVQDIDGIAIDNVRVMPPLTGYSIDSVNKTLTVPTAPAAGEVLKIVTSAPSTMA